ncbi:MAG: hypothetical protein NTW29_11980 [Bacteroidetes bacterium]|nr:hypothetical protein [Bacteroidota bacterium]
MKKTILLAACMVAVVFVHAQQKDWKEMHDFHGIMSVTFHPAEENNLQPLKDSANSLLTKAKVWQQSVVPEGYNAAITQPILKRLAAECAAIAAAVKRKKPDSELKAMITKAHDTFHEIMEKCRKPE